MIHNVKSVFFEKIKTSHDLVVFVIILIGTLFWFVFNGQVTDLILSEPIYRVLSINPIVQKSGKVFGVGSLVNIAYGYWTFFIPVFFMICLNSRSIKQNISLADYRIPRIVFAITCAATLLATFPLDIRVGGASRLDNLMFYNMLFIPIVAALISYLVVVLLAWAACGIIAVAKDKY